MYWDLGIIQALLWKTCRGLRQLVRTQNLAHVRLIHQIGIQEGISDCLLRRIYVFARPSKACKWYWTIFLDCLRGMLLFRTSVEIGVKSS